MASILKVDTLTGVTTAGSIAVTGEGNSTTTNLQQGLAKAFLSFDFGGNSTPDSFNISSVTDRATGCLFGNFTNSMSNAGYAVPAGVSPAAEGSMLTANNNRYCISSGDSTARYSQNNCEVGSAGTFSDVPYCCASIHGDLA